MRKLDEDTKQKLRETLFPAMDLELTTGYNIYEKPFAPRKDYDFLISYMHVLTSGDEHWEALKNKFKKEFAGERQIYRIIPRDAKYLITKESWIREEEGMKLYNASCERLNYSEALAHFRSKNTVIGEEDQNELKFYVKSERFGKFIKEFDEAVRTLVGFWEVPSTNISPGKKELIKIIPETFVGVLKLGITGFKEEVSFTITDKKIWLMRNYIESFDFSTNEPQRIFCNKDLFEYMEKIEKPADYEEFSKFVEKCIERNEVKRISDTVRRRYFGDKRKK